MEKSIYITLSEKNELNKNFDKLITEIQIGLVVIEMHHAFSSSTKIYLDIFYISNYICIVYRVS